MGTFLLVGVNEHHFQKHNQEKSISQIPINTCQNGKKSQKLVKMVSFLYQKLCYFFLAVPFLFFLFLVKKS